MHAWTAERPERHRGSDLTRSGDRRAEGTHLMSERFDHVVFVVYKRKGAHVMHKVEGFGRDDKVYQTAFLKIDYPFRLAKKVGVCASPP